MLEFVYVIIALWQKLKWYCFWNGYWFSIQKQVLFSYIDSSLFLQHVNILSKQDRKRYSFVWGEYGCIVTSELLTQILNSISLLLSQKASNKRMLSVDKTLQLQEEK